MDNTVKAWACIILMAAGPLVSAQVQATKEVSTAVEREFAHMKELYRSELAALKLALDLQAAEYERRLKILNHEAEQLKSMQANYVPRETFEAMQKNISLELSTQAKQIEELNTWKATIVGQIALFGVALTIIMFLISKFLPLRKQQPTT